MVALPPKVNVIGLKGSSALRDYLSWDPRTAVPRINSATTVVPFLVTMVHFLATDAPDPGVTAAKPINPATISASIPGANALGPNEG